MQKRKNGISSIIFRLSVIFLVLLFIILFAMLRNIWEVKQLAYECMADKASLYVELLGKEIENLSTEFLVMRVRDNKELERIPESISPNQSQYYELIDDITDANFTKRTVYEGKYSFYEYVYSADFLIIDSGVYFPASRRTAEAETLRERVRELIEENDSGVIWNFFEADGYDYLYGALQQDGRAVGCVAKLDDLFANMRIRNLGYEGIPFFERDQALFMGSNARGREDVQELIVQGANREGMTDDYAWYTYELKRVGDFKILLLLSRGVLDRLFHIQAVLVFAFILIVAVALWIFLYFYRKILKPMRGFVEGLKNPEEDTWLNDTEKNGIVELEVASRQFREMFRELQSLRIAVYEKELARKRIELEYVREQVRPHFFLNCLSIIQSMAELHHAEDIVRISDVVSNYMRYVIKDTFELRTIKDELEHIQSYIDIQQIRVPGAFTYEVIMEEEIGKYKIPPLLLQVFVENSVCHGLIAGGHIEITLYLTIETMDGKNFLYITLSDTGNGFPEKILRAVEEDTPIVYDGREHIGIRNTIKRLKILYGDQASIRLCNMAENYGAVVEIVIPSVFSGDC